MHGISSPFYWLSTIISLLKHYLRIMQLNLRDRDNLRTKDKRSVLKVSFVRRFDCILQSVLLYTCTNRHCSFPCHVNCKTHKLSVAYICTFSSSWSNFNCCSTPISRSIVISWYIPCGSQIQSTCMMYNKWICHYKNIWVISLSQCMHHVCDTPWSSRGTVDCNLLYFQKNSKPSLS